MLKVIIISLSFICSGCDVEELDCPVDQRFIDYYEDIEFPSGQVIQQAVYACPLERV